MAREYRITPEVLAHARTLGIYGETAEARIKQMAKLAAKITHPDATHRFRQYIMMIENVSDELRMVTMLDLMDPTERNYYSHRRWEDRRAEQQEDVPGADDEAIVTPKNPYRS